MRPRSHTFQLSLHTTKSPYECTKYVILLRPANGYLAWVVQVVQALNICRIASLDYHSSHAKGLVVNGVGGVVGGGFDIIVISTILMCVLLHTVQSTPPRGPRSGSR